jgi:hypothetical protein
LPVQSVADLVALAKKRFAEGKPLTYVSGGVATRRLCEVGNRALGQGKSANLAGTQ